MNNDTGNARDISLPVYNIKAVARMTGLRPVTLRAWERRYGLPSPSRGDQGYRLYSEYDLRTLRWLKFQINSGLNISRAVDYLVELRAMDRDPATKSTPDSSAQAVSLDYLSSELLRSLLHFDDASANEHMRKAFTLYSVDQVLTSVVEPVMVEVGEAWHRGELPIAIEHYATHFFIQQLNGMLASSSPVAHRGVIVAAGAPGEQHEVGLLLLVVMLRWRGWDVKYLGPDLKLDRLEEAVGLLHPRVLLFSATRPETAKALEAELVELTKRFPHPQPLIALGGQAFRLPDIDTPSVGTVINDAPAEMVTAIEKLLARPV